MANGHGGARPGAGRPKGSVDERAKEFRERFEKACKEYGLDFDKGIVQLLMSDSEDIRLRATSMILPYMYPKLRHVEITPNTPTEPVFKLIVEKEKDE